MATGAPTGGGAPTGTGAPTGSGAPKAGGAPKSGGGGGRRGGRIAGRLWLVPADVAREISQGRNRPSMVMPMKRDWRS